MTGLQFATPLPWWMLLIIVACMFGAAWASYVRPLAPLTRRRRTVLTTLRAAVLAVLVACLLRPVRVLPPESYERAVVPILVDASRSMALTDAGARTRFAAALDLAVKVEPMLGARFDVDAWTFGDTLVRRPASALAAGSAAPGEGRSELSGALGDLRERYRGRRVAGIVVISDGGDTGGGDPAAIAEDAGVPVHTIGVGSAQVPADVEVLDVSAGPGTLPDSSVDLTVAVVSHAASESVEIRVLENGRLVDARRLNALPAGRPARAVFTVSPPADVPAVYTVEVPPAAGDVAVENNRRSIVVQPPGRRRRVLMIEGAPGFEHSFLKRALAADPGLEVDSVVRKGRDAQGRATYFVQASADRAPRLASGFANDRDALFAYDALLLANMDPDALSGVQMELVGAFVAERGGGLLVLGAKSFAQRGLAGTPIAPVLPVSLAGDDSFVRASEGAAMKVALTDAGRGHPVMRVGSSSEETVTRWGALPPLSAASVVGGPRPGAQVLAVVGGRDGERPLVAVQRYGLGRAMVFGGEASWRWRMRMPSNDRTYERFWRQAARWLAGDAPGRVSIVAPPEAIPGDSGAIAVDVRDRSFAPVTDAVVSLRMTTPDGRTVDLQPTLIDARGGRYATDNIRFEQPGLYRLSATVGEGDALATERWMLVGGADREMADARLNEEVLRRVSRASGGSYLTQDAIDRLPSLFAGDAAIAGAPRVVEVWHSAWVFALAIALLGSEWFLRRKWGLR